MKYETVPLDSCTWLEIYKDVILAKVSLPPGTLIRGATVNTTVRIPIKVLKEKLKTAA